MSKFNETRKADRAKMAIIVAGMAREYGAAALVSPEGSGLFPNRVTVDIEAARGLRVSVKFDGEKGRPNTYILSWNISGHSDARLSDRFARLGSVNQHHFRKATYVAHGFDALCLALEFGLELARNGAAFDAEREARAIAMEGTAAENVARWGTYFEGVAA